MKNTKGGQNQKQTWDAQHSASKKRAKKDILW